MATEVACSPTAAAHIPDHQLSIGPDLWSIDVAIHPHRSRRLGRTNRHERVGWFWFPF